MKPSIASTAFLGAAMLSLPLAAQTTTAPAKSSSSTAAHASTATHASASASPCATTPPHQPKSLPALPASAACPKVLYTLRSTLPTHLVYASPLLSRELRETLGDSTSTFSLDYVDTAVGTGAAVRAGDYITVKYAGYLSTPDAKDLKQDGTKFDDSDDHPGKEPITIQYGTHGVIEGWDTGFEGMHVGGKRRLFIPWQLAYGERGRPPRIPAKADLIFDVEVVSQSSTPPAPPARPMPMTPHPGMPGAGTPPHSTTITPQPPQTTAPGSTTAPQSGTSTTPPPTAQPQSTATPPATTTQPNKPQ